MHMNVIGLVNKENPSLTIGDLKVNDVLITHHIREGHYMDILKCASHH